MKKKAQLMVFVVVGIVVVFLLGAMYYTAQITKEKQLEMESAKVSELFGKKDKYNAYVQSCLDYVAKEALFLVGKQGGAIYDTQISNGNGKLYLGPERGSPLGKFVLPYKSPKDECFYNLSYAIFRPKLDLTLSHPSPPNYPIPNYPAPEPNGKYSESPPPYPVFNLYGNFPQPGPLTPLCDYNGPNAPGKKGSLFSCETYDSPLISSQNSIQEYIQLYIEDKMADCVDLSSIKELRDYTIEEGIVNASVTLSPNYVYINITFPISVYKEDEKAKLELNEFNVRYRLRLKKIHELISHLVRRDINDLFFDIDGQAGELNDCISVQGHNEYCLRPGMTVEIKRDVCSNCGEGQKDDILVINDTDSILDGKAYTFQVAIENRAPVLGYILQPESNIHEEEIYGIYKQGKTIEIKPTAFDPDEDFYEEGKEMARGYIYEGWLATGFDTWKGGSPVFKDGFPSASCNELESDTLVSGCVQEGPEILNPNMMHWKDLDDDSKPPKRNAYLTLPDEITDSNLYGIHRLRVKISDGDNEISSAGLTDFQDIYILVYKEEPEEEPT